MDGMFVRLIFAYSKIQSTSGKVNQLKNQQK
jgi:hypothetical protein